MYPAIAAAGGKVKADTAVLDGEIVAMSSKGRPSFQALQHRGAHADHHIDYYAFDVLHVDGRDLTGEPLTARRGALAPLIDSSGLRLSEELSGTALDVVKAVKAMGLEGVVAKRKASIYVPGERSADWVKLKLDRQQEFVIGGYRPDGAESIDALLVGYYDGEQLLYAAKVRAGLVTYARRELRKMLAPLRMPECPFTNLPSEAASRWGGGVTADEMREMHWVRPMGVAQIQFAEWTAEGRLRHAKFLGLRSDKDARNVSRER